MEKIYFKFPEIKIHFQCLQNIENLKKILQENKNSEYQNSSEKEKKLFDLGSGTSLRLKINRKNSDKKKYREIKLVEIKEPIKSPRQSGFEQWNDSNDVSTAISFN